MIKITCHCIVKKWRVRESKRNCYREKKNIAAIEAKETIIEKKRENGREKRRKSNI